MVKWALVYLCLLDTESQSLNQLLKLNSSMWPGFECCHPRLWERRCTRSQLFHSMIRAIFTPNGCLSCAPIHFHQYLFNYQFIDNGWNHHCVVISHGKDSWAAPLGLLLKDGSQRCTNWLSGLLSFSLSRTPGLVSSLSPCKHLSHTRFLCTSIPFWVPSQLISPRSLQEPFMRRPRRLILIKDAF